ncbi:MAG: acyl-CoA thioesterase [Acetobacterales bacterium]
MSTNDCLPDAEPALRVVAMPKDANPFGDIFGGWIMAHMDSAGGTAAIRRAQGRVATVAVESFTFRQPVHVGDVVSFYAFEERIGNTSLTFRVQAWREGRDGRGAIMVTDGLFTFVAIDEDRRKRPVPPAA